MGRYRIPAHIPPPRVVPVPEVIEALVEYGVDFSKARPPPSRQNQVVRRPAVAACITMAMAAAVACCHGGCTRTDDSAVAWPMASQAQQRRPADLARLVILARIAPGATPKKPKAPDGAVDGQIRLWPRCRRPALRPASQAGQGVGQEQGREGRHIQQLPLRTDTNVLGERPRCRR